MLIARTADRRPILFEHRGEDLQARGDGELHQLGPRIDEEIDERQMALASVNRLGGTDRLCETLVSWRLLVGGLSPGASHHSYTTSSEEPPLSNFNSQWDIPSALVADAIDVRRPVAHLAPAVLADVPPADIVSPQDQDVGLLRWHDLTLLLRLT